MIYKSANKTRAILYSTGPSYTIVEAFELDIGYSSRWNLLPRS